MYKLENQPSAADVAERFAALSEELQGRAIRAGLVAASKPIKAGLKAESPDDSGQFDRSIGHASLSVTARGRLGLPADRPALLVGPVRKVNKRRQGWKLKYLEQGALPHVIKARDGALRLRGGRLASRVKHPGFTAIPVRERALSVADSQIQPLFFRGMSNYLRRKGF